jgi:hypothetical protein
LAGLVPAINDLIVNPKGGDHRAKPGGDDLSIERSEKNGPCKVLYSF